MPAAPAIARTLRRAAVAAAAALLIYALSTRINPPPEPEFFDGRPRPADHVIDDVQIDLTSIPAALESLRQAAPDYLAFDPATLPADQTQPLGSLPNSTIQIRYVRARHVRLGTALAYVLKQAPGTTPIQTRFEPTRIVVGGPGTAPTEILVRRHDVRDLKFGHNSIADAGAAARMSPTDLSQLCESLAEAISTEIPYPPQGGGVRPYAWGNHIYVVGAADTQRAAEHILAFLRQTGVIE